MRQISYGSNTGGDVIEKNMKILEHYAQGYTIFIDTCSLLHEQSENFMQNIIPFLVKHNNVIIVPIEVVKEIERHMNQTEKRELREKSKTMIKLLREWLDAGYIQLRGAPDDIFPDALFQQMFMKYRLSDKLLLITNDGKLAEDIMGINKNLSVDGHRISAKRINKYGYLSNFNFQGLTGESGASHRPASTVAPVIPSEEMFSHKTTVTNVAQTPIFLTSVPKSGDIIRLGDGTSRRVGALIGKGGEGSTYELDEDTVVKIYSKVTQRMHDKLMLMLSKKINCEGICYPQQPVYNSYGQFVGFTMLRARGKEIRRSLHMPMIIKRNYADWTKEDMVQLCITILEKIQFLHDRNIIIGDINPANILVESPKEVYFVDVDSYQIEDFPCPVGTINYTAPEIQGRKYAEFLRTPGNEYFAVATLLFMLMLPGKLPYAQQGGGTMGENIEAGDFSFPLGEFSNKKAPDGSWRFMWSHLAYDIKKAFYTTFKKGEEHSTEETRYTVKEWLRLFKRYQKALPSMAENDSMSTDIFPTRYKKNPNATYITCRLCREDVEEERTVEGICRACLKKGREYQCRGCGKDMVFTNYHKHIKHMLKPYEYCRECSDFRKSIYTTKSCEQCGKDFDITHSEREFFKSKGFELPKNCKECRRNRTGSSNSCGTSTQTYTPLGTRKSVYTQSGRTAPTRSAGTSDKKSSGCFITTAVCEYRNKSDDCAELTAFRAFRDGWLRAQPDGAELIYEYYDIAPAIVEKMKLSPKYAQYCEVLWWEYLTKCLELIKEEKYEQCKEKYIEMVNYLKNELM